MFRTAILRFPAVARPAVRTVSKVSRLAALPARTVAPATTIAPRVAAWNTVRCYSAAAGLKKEEVEGRIMGLLAGFDKVRSSESLGFLIPVLSREMFCFLLNARQSPLRGVLIP